MTQCFFKKLFNFCQQPKKEKYLLKLYDLSGKNDLRFSPSCWVVKICLIHRQINFETEPVRFSEKNKIEFSNQQLVPILKHNNGFVCDSWNILNWLHENYNNKNIFGNLSSKNFSYFLYLWTSRQLLPILFKIIAHEIPNILEGKDLDYFIRTREKRINGPITKFKSTIPTSIKQFRKLINPIRKIIQINDFISGKEIGVEDYIFFGNFKWVYSCSSCDLLDVNDPVFLWYKKILKLTKL